MNVQATRPADVIAAELGGSITGRIVTPDTGDYDEVRRVFLGDVDHHPAAIARVASATDVARVVEYALETGTELAVRAGGHSNAGHGGNDGGIALDVRELKGIDLDTAGKSVWADSGLTAAELTTATVDKGLVVGFGDTGSVGIAGITLGGGIGYLTRKYGMTIDSLRAAEIVTADGDIRTVDAEHDPDLFWAIRGGGGNFGVATRFKYGLHDIGTVTGGFIMLPATPETIEGFIAAAEAAPEELSTIANVMPAPPMPFVPEEAQGKLVVFGLMVHSGDVEAGERAVAPFRALAKPIVDMIRPMAYPEMYGPEDPNYRPTPVQKTLMVNRVNRDKAGAIIRFLEESDAPLRAVQLRVLGGAMARVPAESTAFAHRQSKILGVVVAFHDNTPEGRAKRQVWVDDLSALLYDGDPGAYVNFLSNEGPERVRAAYPGASWDRLVEIKRRYDPTNLFRSNQNIPPA
jgi:FAD/FMN-containing dehydrogenase